MQVHRELIEDTDADAMLTRILGDVMALRLDLAALYGSGTAPEPRGVVNTTGINTASMGANGLALSNYDPLADAVGVLADFNFTEPTAAIMAPRTARALGKLKDTTNQPLVRPPYLAALPMLTTNQVPVNLTQGTATTASDVFVADWREMWIGMRTNFQVQVLRERNADTGTIGLLAWLRADVLVARPRAFYVLRGVL